jgi:gliding motility-associated-like protein
MRFIFVLFILFFSFCSRGSIHNFPQDSIVKDSCEILVPNYFHGHGDCVNDQVCVHGKCIREMNLKIYDRWGSLIFESPDQKKCWDGKSKGKQCAQGTYFYILKAVSTTGKEISMQGHISLYR